MPRNPSTTEGQSAEQFHQRLENFAHPARGDLGDVDGRSNPKGNGDQRRADRHDQRAGDQRQDAKIIFDGIPAGAEQS